MSSANIAVKVFRILEPEDFRVLQVIEADMAGHRYVPEKELSVLNNCSNDTYKTLCTSSTESSRPKPV